MNAPSRILLACALLGAGCAARPAQTNQVSPRPPADLTIAVTVIAAEGASPTPARFVIEPGGQLRAAVGAGTTTDALPPRTRRLTDAQLTQLYGMILREGLALPGENLNETQPRIEVTVIAGDKRRTGRHTLDDAQARALVTRCRGLARLDP